MNAHILIVDDEPLIRQSLRKVVDGEGFVTSVAATCAQAWERFVSDGPDVVLLDLALPDGDGLELLQRMRAHAPLVKVVVVTAHSSLKNAVRAMRLGGYEFLKKPFEMEEVVAAVRNAARTSSLEGQVEYLRERAQPGVLLLGSPVMTRTVAQVDLLARSPVQTVLVMGESGTGKQLVARRLHDQSPRAAGPFVELNCSAVPENLVESEFFGHERGAFSDARERKLGLVEVADGGTLFLDEIGDLGQGAQAKLLTFLEQRTFRRVGATALRRVDTRIVAATNRDLEAQVAVRGFREDLWYRISAMVVRLPPLRERAEDVGLLAQHFLQRANQEFGRRFRALSPEAEGLLRGYRWPGNVRELQAVVSRAVLLHDAEVLLPEHLPPELTRVALLAGSEPADAAAGALGQGGIPTLAEVELAYIRRVLKLCAGNRSLAAQRLGISRQTLAKRLNEDEA